MKISIITATYNSSNTVKHTLDSICNQNHNDIEVIIVDGKSSDNTLEIVKTYEDRLTMKIISESDQGLYDAMNKGIKIATGEIIGILNSDDFYKNNLVLEKIATRFKNNPQIDACYADLEFVDEKNTNKVVRIWQAGEFDEKKLDNGWVIPHPTFFARKEVYEKYGIFNLDFKIAADYELILRLLKLHKIRLAYLPEIIVSMRTGGVSTKNLKQRRKGWQELKKAWKVNNLRLPKFFILRRILFKVVQYL